MLYCVRDRGSRSGGGTRVYTTHFVPSTCNALFNYILTVYIII